MSRERGLFRTRQRLLDYSWPGNVRELQNVIERAVILSEGEVLHVEEQELGEKHEAASTAPSIPRALRDRTLIETVLAALHGRVSSSRGAAAKLDISAITLESKLRRFGIDKYTFRAPRVL